METIISLGKQKLIPQLYAETCYDAEVINWFLEDGMKDQQVCLNRINLILKFTKKVQDFLSFCMQYEAEIQEKLDSLMNEEDKKNALNYLSKCSLLQKEINKIAEEVVFVKNDIDQNGESISPKFYAFLNKQYTMISNLGIELRNWKSVSYRDQDRDYNYHSSLMRFEHPKTNIKSYLDSTGFFSGKERTKNITVITIGQLKFISENLIYLSINNQLVKLFSAFKKKQNNIVLIGPNGCGKNSFAQLASEYLDIQVKVIPAQKIFYNTPMKSEVLYGDIIKKEFSKAQKQIKQKESDTGFEVLHYFDGLMQNLIREHALLAIREHENNTLRKESELDEVINIWNQVITYREMKYQFGSLGIHIIVQNEKRKQYPFMSLSDGEKAVFYNIAHTICAEKDSYVVVDEPENHLNLAVATKLWDKLESMRKDCQFIYLTHNPDFALSRKNSSIFQVDNISQGITEKSICTEMEPIEGIDSRLMIQLVGSRKQILFCEGERNSLDYKVYSTLFLEYTVTPVGGCREVINCTRMCNKTKSFHNSAIGIVDGDFHTDEEVEMLEKDLIHCLRLPEIENLLCDEILLNAGCDNFHPSHTNAIQVAKNKLLSLLSNDKENQATSYAHSIIVAKMKNLNLRRKNSLADLLTEYATLEYTTKDEIVQLYNQRLNEITQTVEAKDYEKALKLYNSKSIITITKTIVDDYKNRIIGVLSDDRELCTVIIQKYFHKLSEN